MSGTAREVVQARDINGDVHFHGNGFRGDGALPPGVPQQLPRDARIFVNRSRETDELDAVFSSEAHELRSTSIHFIAGTAGVGKTSFALHWAHRLLNHFPDGQLYANLRGYDSDPPATASEIPRRFLSALSVPAPAIPVELEAAAALYRSLSAGRKMLVFLDNAATAGQVRPLLPGSASCLVLVTSRSRLSGLSIRDGARRLTLEPLTETDAVGLLSTVTAGYRTKDDTRQLAELARLCARLPLALRIAAERAASRPYMRLDELIQNLSDASGPWDALTIPDDEGESAVRTVFAWSYRALPSEAARLFRLLGLHSGPDFGAEAAAAVAGATIGQARNQLDLLTGAHLLEQSEPDRYGFHDLLRAYAVDRVQHEESSENRAAAMGRVLSWYLHSADAAQTWINPQEAHVELDAPAVGVRPAAFSSYAEAMNWYELERANLLAATRAAETAGEDRVAWQLPAVPRSVHMLVNPFEEWLTMGDIGLRAARRLGDRQGETELLESLGMAHTQLHRLTEAATYHRAALSLRRDMGNRSGEALSLNDLGLLYLRERRLAEAGDLFSTSRDIFREIDAPHWGAVLTANLAETMHQLGRFDEAFGLAREALETHRQLANRGGEGNALRILSEVRGRLGAYDEARRCAEDAVDIARSHRNRMWEGYWLLSLGRSQLASGRATDALASFGRSGALQRELGDRSREAQAWFGSAEALARLGEFEKSAEFCRDAAVVHRELGDRWQLALALDGLAAAFDQAGKASEARRCSAEALASLGTFDDFWADMVRERIREREREWDRLAVREEPPPVPGDRP
jgi:tetratricopeptide (TPR) repeat protein